MLTKRSAVYAAAAAVTAALLIAACASKKGIIPPSPYFAANRRVTLIEDSQTAKDTSTATLEKFLSDHMYGRFGISLKKSDKTANSFEDAQFKAAAFPADDFIWMKKTGGGYEIFLGNSMKSKPLGKIFVSSTEISPWSVDAQDALEARMQKEFDPAYGNPNTLPTVDLLRLANAAYAAKRCDRALPLYEAYMANKKVVLLQEIQQHAAIQEKMDTCKRLIETHKLIKEDKNKKFAFTWSQKGLSKKYEANLKNAIEKLKLSELLRHYTYKPAKLEVNYNDENKTGLFLLHLRFHPRAYAKWTARKPKEQGGKKILHLSPYYPLFKRLIMLRDALAQQANPLDRKNIESFAITLRLEKLNGDYVDIAVEKGSQEPIRYPSQLRVSVHGFEPAIVKSFDMNLTRQTGLFYLGEAELINGKKTEYGILYDFFGLPY